MRPLFYIVTTLAVMGLAFWAYQQNYQTQTELRRTEALQSEIAALRERLGILRAEWAYLNRPNRLRDLADLNFARLQLVAMSAEQFGRIDEIPFPTPGAEAIENVVVVRANQQEVSQ